MLAAWEQHFEELSLSSIARRDAPHASLSAAQGAASSSSAPASSTTPTAMPEEHRGPLRTQALSLLIRKLPRDSTSRSLATMVEQMGFIIEESRFKAGGSSLKYGFVGFVDDADIFVCLDAVHRLGGKMKADVSMKYGKKDVVKALSKAKAQAMAPSKLPVLITQPDMQPSAQPLAAWAQ